ncbi:MAG: VWA domain-containing protein [Acidobacteria bacterium]|nr:VWA domain-containing protein [Acidobacteriota bacterium]
MIAHSVPAQSGRIKPAESPTRIARPPVMRPSVIYLPAEIPSGEKSPSAKPSTATPAAKDSDEVINVESALVPIPVSVVDSAGRSVANLKLGDFELKIDGQPAEIGELSRSETPIRLVMLFDNSSSVAVAREFEKNAAVKFFRRVLRPDRDLAALFSIASEAVLEQKFTSEISFLTRAIEMFPPPAGATKLLDGVVLAAEYLSETATGRRVIVIVSDGEDTLSDSSLETVNKWLQASNCQVFVVKTTDFENYKRTGVRSGNANLRQLAAERRMLDITGQTGGAVYSPIDERELDDAFRQISAELAQQYVLSYYPENDSANRGAFRQISLAVKGRQNLTIRTRKGYYIPKR